MPESDDIELLREYADHQSEDAFATLVARHINKVYSTALRHVGDPVRAGEITQTVFIILAQKAGRLRRHTLLSAWLYQTTRFAAMTFLKSEIRRTHREQEAYMQATLNDESPDAWPQIRPLLDAAMAALGEADRGIIVLRFFDDLSTKQVAAALGTTEDTAKQRLHRAVEKLRRFFNKRGLTLSAAVLATALSSHSVQAAPAGLAVSIARATAATKGAATSGSTATLIKSTLKLMAWTKAKTAIVAGIAVLLAAGTATVAARKLVEHKPANNGNWWEIEKSRLETAYGQLPQVMVAPTKFTRQEDQTWGDEHGSPIGTGATLIGLIDGAYSATAPRTVLPDDAPSNRYDFIADLPHGSREALQKEIARQMGLVGIRETRETDVLFLTLKNPGAYGLKHPASRLNGSNTMDGPGKISVVNRPLDRLAFELEGYLQIPVIDRTGIRGNFDITLEWHDPDMEHPDLQALNQALLEQLGLELVPTNMPVEMLVVTHADN
jgi:uncharacterized protein (TIGR03435 family)